jgi:hypothetical protein
MEGESPEAVFAEARDAIALREWERAFACFERNDLLRIAGNSMRALLDVEPVRSDLVALAERDGFPERAIRGGR